MITIKKDDALFSVDIEKTKNYYEIHSLCNCKECHHYYAHIKNKFPKLDKFLSEFGVDISKPDEASSVDMGSYVDYLTVYYSVCGKPVSAKEHQFGLFDNLPLRVTINGEYAPNEQVGDYFMISVAGIKLPLR